MSGRSQARLLAPIALVVTVVALISVVSGGSGDDGNGSSAGSGDGRPAATTTASKKGAGTQKKRSLRRYTVKAGDTPSSIAEAAGIPLDRLLQLNPEIDPQALSPGQKLKLAP